MGGVESVGVSVEVLFEGVSEVVCEVAPEVSELASEGACEVVCKVDSDPVSNSEAVSVNVFHAEPVAMFEAVDREKEVLPKSDPYDGSGVAVSEEVKREDTSDCASEDELDVDNTISVLEADDWATVDDIITVSTPLLETRHSSQSGSVKHSKYLACSQSAVKPSPSARRQRKTLTPCSPYRRSSHNHTSHHTHHLRTPSSRPASPSR